MAYYHPEPVRTAFGRPLSTRTNDTTGLGLLFLLFVLGGVLAIGVVAEAATSEGSITSQISRALGGGTPKRVQAGYVPPAEAAAAPAVDAAVQSPAQPEPLVQPTAAPTAAPAPTRTADQFRVANTDGVGLVFHTAPSRGARIPRGIMEGARVTILERAGTDWARVRTADGQEGWVGAAYLVPVQ
jgi:hypothetical protein